MILLTVQDIRKHYGPEPVLDGITFDLRKGERVSIVGPNGTGKTTLLKILAGHEDSDGGQRQLHPSATIGYLEQQPEFVAGRTVWQEALDALRELVVLSQEAEELGHRLAEAADDAQRKKLGQRFDYLQLELQRRDAYHLDHKIEQVLVGLGFTPAMYEQEVVLLSGGQQNRLLLAKLLLQDPAVLLLDEPSNHLDLQATRWLEDYLVNTSQSLLVVSHDRYFLDKVTNRTLELYQGTIDQYAGNFSAYQRQKTERLEVQRRTFLKQQTEIAKMEDFVRRNHYGQKHAQAEDRRKKLERLERVDAPREIIAPSMSFPSAARSGDIVLRVEHLSKSYDKPLFTDLSLDMLRGEKWAVLGPNGCGKTTLIRCLLAQTAPDAGRVVIGAGVKIAYFDQHLQCLDPAQMVVDAIRPGHKEFVEGQRRELLARYGITGEMVFQRVDSLSGGERNRAALAFLAGQDANLLVLDEPTNHLDLWARASLEKAIRKFDGTVLLVSHDRYFLNQVADHLIVMQPGSVQVLAGNYDTYLNHVAYGLIPAAAANPANGTPAEPSKKLERERDRPARRKRQFPYRKVEDIEADIHTCEARIADVHQQLASPDLRDGLRIKGLMGTLETEQERLAQLLAHWEEASELN